jgi:drug/metabolite transporter (DMT)-like permease
MINLNPLQRASILALLSMLGLGITNALVKIYSPDYSHTQLLFLRSVVGLLIISPIVLRHSGWRQLKTQRLMGHIWRGFIGVASLWLAFFCYHSLPLGTAVALIMTNPFFVAIISNQYLGEPMPLKYWGYVLLGFVGVALISRPIITTDTNYLMIGAGLLSALCWALARLSTRSLTRTENPTLVVFYFFVMGVVCTLIPILIFDGQWSPVRSEDLIGLIAPGILAVVIQLLITRALELAPAWQIAPLEYSLLLWAVGFDWLLWDKIPTLLTVTGAAMITITGIVLMRRRAVTKS